MAIQLPNGKISRTLPEQVGFNSQKIAEIIKFLNESGLKDQVINLTSLSGTLTPEQYAIAELSPSYIVYEGSIFFKAVEDLSNIDYFELNLQIEIDSSMLLNMSRIRIVRDTRAYSQSYVNIFESYNKTQLDSLLAQKANLSGANFTGAITAPSIIENMSGYSMTLVSNLLSINYAGICKNGNKLTIAVSGIYSHAGDSGLSALKIYIPVEVYNKLYPAAIPDTSATNILSIAPMYFQNGSAYSVGTVGGGQLSKSSTEGELDLRFYGLSSLTSGKDYLFRYEVTFLLGNSLV